MPLPKITDERSRTEGCTDCANAWVLADTEDWFAPLCEDCYAVMFPHDRDMQHDHASRRQGEVSDNA